MSFNFFNTNRVIHHCIFVFLARSRLQRFFLKKYKIYGFFKSSKLWCGQWNGRVRNEFGIKRPDIVMMKVSINGLPWIQFYLTKIEVATINHRKNIKIKNDDQKN